MARPRSEWPEKTSSALRVLRTRARLSRGEVVERVRANGGELSEVFLGEVERGKRSMTPQRLDDVLAAIDATRAELEDVRSDPALRSPEELKTATRRYRRSATNTPETYYDPAKAAPGPVPPAMAAPRAASNNLMASEAGDLAAGTAMAYDAAPAAGDEAELIALYRRLGRSDQLTLLADLRGRAGS